MRTFFHWLTWWPTLVVTLSQVGFSLFAVAQVTPAARTNVWDLFFAQFSETRTLVLLGLLWWVVVIARQVPRIATPEWLIRQGSPARAAVFAIRRTLAPLTALATALVAATLSVAFPLGLNLHWSEETHAGISALDTGSAFSAATLATHFDSPLSGLIALMAYWMTAFILVAAFSVIITIRFGSRAGHALLWSSYGVFAVGSFIGFPNDVASGTVFSLSWALHTDTLSVGIAVFAVVFVAALMLAAKSPAALRRNIRRFFRQRAALLLPLVAFAAFAMWKPRTTALDATESAPALHHAAEFFAGRHDDLIGYAVTLLTVFAIVTGSVVRVRESLHSLALFEQITLRVGSMRRWVARTMSHELPWLLFGTAIMCVTVFCVTQLRTPSAFSLTQASRLIGGAGLAIALLATTLFALVLILMWRFPIDTLWPVIAGSALVVGYSLPAEAPNLAAPYSVSPGTSHIDPIALALIAVSALVATTAALVTPAHHTAPHPVSS